MPPPATPTPSTWQEVQGHFGFSVAALGRVLGLSRPMMGQVVAGRRSLPPAARLTWARLVLALAPAQPPEPAPGPAFAFAPAHPLALHAQGCLATAARLAVELADAQSRAAGAERRLAALPQLAAPLRPADGPGPPAWLGQFESEARVALVQYGPVAQARLAVRRAGLLAEAHAVEKLFSGVKIYDLADERIATTFSTIINPLPTFPLMSFSVSRFTTKAQCQAYLDKKATERPQLVAHQAQVQAILAAWDASGDPTADLAVSQDFVTTLTAKLAATTDPKQRLRTERLLNSERNRVTNLSGRSVTHGTDDLLDHEQDRDEVASDLAILDGLVVAVTARRDALPS